MHGQMNGLTREHHLYMYHTPLASRLAGGNASSTDHPTRNQSKMDLKCLLLIWRGSPVPIWRGPPAKRLGCLLGIAALIDAATGYSRTQKWKNISAMPEAYMHRETGWRFSEQQLQQRNDAR